MKFVASGVDSRPTIQFSGANVQIVNGSTKQTTANGAGNLVIGYDESPGSQTGSHNIVMGSKQTYVATGGLMNGESNSLNSTNGVVFGVENVVDGAVASTILGGRNGVSSGEYSTVSGGIKNEATDPYAAVGGGFKNVASGGYAFVGGGAINQATEFDSSVLGGEFNLAGAQGAAVFGGQANEATGKDSAVLGGKGVKVSTEFGHTP